MVFKLIPPHPQNIFILNKKRDLPDISNPNVMIPKLLKTKDLKGHFTKVYSIKVCEPQNFPGFPWDPVIGLDSIQTVCLQLNPIGGSQGNPRKFWGSQTLIE